LLLKGNAPPTPLIPRKLTQSDTVRFSVILDSRLRGNERSLVDVNANSLPLTPAKAGVQAHSLGVCKLLPWIPAFAGMSGKEIRPLR
jgi:hypothetical protein